MRLAPLIGIGRLLKTPLAGLRHSNDPPNVQAIGRGGLPYCRGVAARGAREVDTAWAPVHAAPVVGSTASGIVAGGADGAAAAGPLRPSLPGGVQGWRPCGPTGDAQPPIELGRRRRDR